MEIRSLEVKDEPSTSVIFTKTESEDGTNNDKYTSPNTISTTSLPPPPPPPPPTSSSQTTKAPIISSDKGRADLMQAIREAGGTGKMRLKHVEAQSVI